MTAELIPSRAQAPAILGGEERALIGRCIKASGTRATEARIERLARAVERGIAFYTRQKQSRRLSFRQRHDMLRKLYVLATSNDPPIGQLRARIAALPDQIADELDLAAPMILTALDQPSFGLRLNARKPIHAEQWSRAGGIRVWARKAPPDKLTRAIMALTAQGGTVVPGRRREPGGRSAPRFEPRILGAVRGAGSRAHAGRPSWLPQQLVLIGLLAAEFKKVTGKPPDPGRSARSPFGNLVHMVFGWIGEPLSAERALRAFWRDMAKL